MLPRFLADHEIDALETSLSMNTGSLADARALLEFPWCLSLARRIHADRRLSRVWPATLHAVLCTYFEKSAAENCLVAL